MIKKNLYDIGDTLKFLYKLYRLFFQGILHSVGFYMLYFFICFSVVLNFFVFCQITLLGYVLIVIFKLFTVLHGVLGSVSIIEDYIFDKYCQIFFSTFLFLLLPKLLFLSVT